MVLVIRPAPLQMSSSEQAQIDASIRSQSNDSARPSASNKRKHISKQQVRLCPLLCSSLL